MKAYNRELSPVTILNSDLSEAVPYNNPAFPSYITIGQLARFMNYRAVSHWHDDLEFICIMDGSMSYEVNGQHITMQTGEGIFVNSRCLHYGYSSSHTDCTFICILLSPQLLSSNEYFVHDCLEPLMQNTALPYQKLSPAVPWQNLILKDLTELYEETAEQERPFLVIHKFAHILDLLSRNSNPVSVTFQASDDDIRAITAMTGYVQKHFSDKILLKDIANAGNCCKTKCTALFQKYLSLSPVLYLNSYRLEKSSQFLRNTTLSVTEIAYACGFASASYFCKTFTENYGISPKAYRKQLL